MMKLIDDDHIKVRRRQVRKTRGRQTLDGRKDGLELLGSLPAHPEFAE